MGICSVRRGTFLFARFDLMKVVIFLDMCCLLLMFFFCFFGRICCKFSYFCICLFVLNSGSCLELGFVVIF